MSTATITIRQTGSPSRSKMAGPCYVRIGTVHETATYAATNARSVQAEAGSFVPIEARCQLRRASRNTDERETWQLVVTGNEADMVTVELGSPQSITAVVTGCVLAGA